MWQIIVKSLVTNFIYWKYCITIDNYRFPVILSQPEDVEIVWGCVIKLTVKACGAGLRYQWYFEKNKIPGMLNHTT